MAGHAFWWVSDDRALASNAVELLELLADHVAATTGDGRRDASAFSEAVDQDARQTVPDARPKR